MKIKRSPKSISSACEILAFIQGNKDATARWQDAVISIWRGDGDLLFYNSSCGTMTDSETVLIDRLESDSMGDGWESATAEDVIDWLETNCEA